MAKSYARSGGRRVYVETEGADGLRKRRNSIPCTLHDRTGHRSFEFCTYFSVEFVDTDGKQIRLADGL